ncbi:MAG TPA: cellulase family glycosylhydrolase [Rugosimonospora sp.]
MLFVRRIRFTRRVCVVAGAATLVLLSMVSFGPAAQARTAGGVHPDAVGAALPSGYLSRAGSAIVDAAGNRVRIAAVGLHGLSDLDQTVLVNANSPLPGLAANFGAARGAGFNTVTVGWNDASLHDSNASAYLNGIDAVVRAASETGLKVILNHHNDEGVAGTHNCEAQQSNGLWYDSGPGTDGTDDCGTAGTVTQASFLADWKQIATRYAGNSTVIGFDLDNEPLAYAGESTWGDGGVNDIHQMYTTVGSAVEAIDPGVLVICEGPQNYGGTYAGASGVTAPEGDLTRVASDPVVLSQGSSHVIYSVHEYPYEINHVVQDSGAAAVARYNAVWGYLVTNHIAPVWIGEAGSTMSNADDTNWASTLTAYVNGQEAASGGPALTGTEQGVSTTWWIWDDEGTGTLNSDGSLNQPRYAVYSQWWMTAT